MRKAALFLLFCLVTAGGAQADTRTERMVAPGVKHITLVRTAGPWVIHILECNRAEPLVFPAAALASGEVVGLAPLTRVAREIAAPGRTPVALVNADFFSMDSADPYQGDPLGCYVEAGELISNPSERSCLLIGPAGELAIARPRLEAWVEHSTAGRTGLFALNQSRPAGVLVAYTPRFGASTRTPATGVEVTLSGLDGGMHPVDDRTLTVVSVNESGNSTIPPGGMVLSGTGPAGDYLRRLAAGDSLKLTVNLTDAPFTPVHVVAGGPCLLSAGVPRGNGDYAAEKFTASFATTRHPRTAVGFNDRTLYLVTVDGRQQASAGMSLAELTALMQELGCREALNLDGGGSTEMWLRGRIANCPSGGAERAIATALALISTAPVGPPHHITLPVQRLEALVGHPVALGAAEVEDQYYNPLPEARVTWDCPPEAGRVEGNAFIAARAGTTTLVAGNGMARATLPVTVYGSPARLVLEPVGGQTVPVGGRCQLRLQAFTREGSLLPLDPARVQWRAQGGTIAAGVLTADKPGQVTAEAVVNGVRATATLIAGQVLFSPLEGFEAAGTESFTGTSRTVTGSVSTTRDQAHEGKQSLCLTYCLPAGTTTETAGIRLNLRLASVRQVALWVYGDGSGLWLRARVRDATGARAPVDLAERLDWTGWRQVFLNAPAHLKRPLYLESVYLVDLHPPGRQGCIYLDQVEIPYLKSITPERSPAVPEPTCTIKRTDRPIKVDGILDEPAWKAAEPLSLLLSDGSGEPAQPTEARLCWDDRYLYVAFHAVDSDIWGTYTQRDQPLFDEEVVEIFVSPTGDLHHYYELEVSPRNVIWDGKMYNPNLTRPGLQGDSAWNCPGLLTGVRVVGTLDNRKDVDQYWSVEMAIPFSAITENGRPPRPGDRWRGNLFRIDLGERDEYSAWSPTLAVPASFHEPKFFGHFIFSGDKA